MRMEQKNGTGRLQNPRSTGLVRRLATVEASWLLGVGILCLIAVAPTILPTRRNVVSLAVLVLLLFASPLAAMFAPVLGVAVAPVIQRRTGEKSFGSNLARSLLVGAFSALVLNYGLTQWNHLVHFLVPIPENYRPPAGPVTPRTTLKYFEEAGFLFCYATLEEICFRFTLTILLARVLLTVSGNANCRLRSTAFWTANVVQALVFTWIHFSVETQLGPVVHRDLARIADISGPHSWLYFLEVGLGDFDIHSLLLEPDFLFPGLGTPQASVHKLARVQTYNHKDAWEDRRSDFAEVG